MLFLERMEWDLPARDFVRDQAPTPRRPVHFRPGSPWRNNRAAGERLTWRGRNFIDAFLDTIGCVLIEAAALDLPAGQCCALTETRRSDRRDGQCFHLICKASADASIQVGADTIAPRAGELWRVDDRRFPAVVCGGGGGGMHLMLIAERNAATESTRCNAAPIYSDGAFVPGQQNRDDTFSQNDNGIEASAEGVDPNPWWVCERVRWQD